MLGDALHPAKLVLLGDMGAGKSSLVLRFVKGQFHDYQVREGEGGGGLEGGSAARKTKNTGEWARARCFALPSRALAVCFFPAGAPVVEPAFGCGRRA